MLRVVEGEENRELQLLRDVCKKIDVSGRDFGIPIWPSAVETSEK
jgi:hypothetical protein